MVRSERVGVVAISEIQSWFGHGDPGRKKLKEEEEEGLLSHRSAEARR